MRLISELLEGAIGRPEVLKSARARMALDHWDEIVGSSLAPFCRPVSYDRGTVTVQAAGSSFAQEIRMSQEAVISRLNDAAKEKLFTELRVTVSYSGPRLGRS